MERPQFTIAQLVAECEREAEMRKTVYARKVREGSMKPKTARRQLDMMTETAARLRQLNDLLYPPAPQGALFK